MVKFSKGFVKEAGEVVIEVDLAAEEVGEVEEVEQQLAG